MRAGEAYRADQAGCLQMAWRCVYAMCPTPIGRLPQIHLRVPLAVAGIV